MERWKNKVALVTGASGGIGEATARALSRAGLRVALWARREERLQEIAAGMPGETLVRKVDMRSEDEILAAFDDLREKWGGTDILIANAGLGHKTTIAEGKTAQWREMLDVNILAPLVCAREALADMRRRQIAGHIVLVSSMAGHRVPSGSGVYSATKFAVRALTEALRQELREAGSDIRASAISPGLTVTGFHETFFASREAADEVYGRHECLSPEDVAESILWILSRPARAEIHDILLRPTAQRS